jgi:glycerol-3-phosphate acyltransferase PlsY
MNDLTIIVIWAIVSYLVGTISVGDLVARTASVDIRTRGTKNPGAANIYRELGPKYGIAVFFLDITKGALATVPLLVMGTPTWGRLVVAVAVVLGHQFPMFSKQPGGTGMATAIGTTVGLAPFGVLGGAPAAILMLLISKNSGYTGAVLFIVTALFVGLFRQDLVGALGVVGIAAIAFVKARFQYAGGSTAE